jgi:hypothetical protein
MKPSIEYVAGLFDGEGYITVDFYRKETGRFTRCQIKSGISLTHRPTIEALAGRFGGVLNVNPSANRRNSNHRVVYAWALSGASSQDFLASVLPFLIIKKSQAKLAIRLHDHVMKHAYAMRYRQYSAEKRESILAYREGLVLQIRDIKKETFPVDSDPTR